MRLLASMSAVMAPVSVCYLCAFFRGANFAYNLGGLFDAINCTM